MAERWRSGRHHPVAVIARKYVQGDWGRFAGRYELAAYRRHLEDLERQGEPEFPWVFDETRADRILRWLGQCRHVRGPLAGQPLRADPCQVFDLGCVYGWVHRETGARRFTVTYNKRARGNWKSTEKSAQCLYHLCADALYPPYRPEEAVYEMQPEVDCAAVDRGQAQRVFGDARLMAINSPAIAKRLRIPKSETARLTHRKLGGWLRALSKDTKNKDSGAPTYVVIDEYHAHPTSLIYDIEKTGMGKRAQSLLDVITTAGEDAQRKPCFREEEYARKILDGDVEAPRYFAMIREAPADGDPHDLSVWLQANPAIRSVVLAEELAQAREEAGGAPLPETCRELRAAALYGGPEELERSASYGRALLGEIQEECRAAYGSGDPDKIRSFLTRRLDRWQTGAVTHYLDERCMELARGAMVDREEFARLTDGLECWPGFDLGKRLDLSGVAAVFLLPDGRVAVSMHGFLPEGAGRRHEQTDRVPYLAWAKEGYVTLTPGDVTDNSYVDNWIKAGERDHRWQVVNIGYDGHNATDLAIAMAEERHSEDICVEVSQTCAGQNMAVKGFRDLLLAGQLVLERSPLALWCLANAVEIQNNYGDIKLSKRHKDDTERIDPVAAAMNGLALALLRKNSPTLSDRLAGGGWTM